MSVIEGRKSWIDQSKGLAIILVVMGHVVTNGISSGVVSDVGFWFLFYKEVYSFHMPLFFLISGYLACPKSLQYDNWGGVKKQLCKILYLLIPYVVFSAIYFFVKLIMGGSGAVMNPVDPRDILYIYKTPIGEYWFLYALILYNIVNLLIIIFVKIVKKDALYSILLFVFTSLALFVAVGIIDVSGFVVNHEGFRRPLLYSVYYFLGIIIAKNRLGIDSNANIICIITAIVASLIYINLLPLQSGVSRFLLAIVMIYIIVRFFKWIDVPLIGRIGEYSLAIYLLHPFFIVLCKMFFLRYVSEFVYVILASVISVTFPYVLYFYIIKRVGILNVFFEPKKYFK